MADDSSQDKTEDPTPRRIDDARKKGQVARSQELSSVAIITAGLVSVFIMAPVMMRQMSAVFTRGFEELGKGNLNIADVPYLFETWGLHFVEIVGPILIALTVVGFFAAFLQVGPLFSVEALEPNFEKLDVSKGIKKIISSKSLFDLFRDSIKITLIGVVAYLTMKAEISNYIPLMDKSLGQILSYGSRIAFKVGIRCALVLLLLAILDFAYQKYTYKKGLRMSKQEVKDEHKQYEGDPLIKSRIKRIQREQARKRMLQNVQSADVVVTNPIHLAVALKYDTDKMNAPTVVAKGQRLIAEKIKELAKKWGVPIVEDRPLAQALYKYAEVGMEIPENLYKAVAEVLAYVYKLKDKVKA